LDGVEISGKEERLEKERATLRVVEVDEKGPVDVPCP
jgi:hypothetical protein